MTISLFEDAERLQSRKGELCFGAFVLRRFAPPDETAIVAALQGSIETALYQLNRLDRALSLSGTLHCKSYKETTG